MITPNSAFPSKGKTFTLSKLYELELIPAVDAARSMESSKVSASRCQLTMSGAARATVASQWDDLSSALNTIEALLPCISHTFTKFLICFQSLSPF